MKYSVLKIILPVFILAAAVLPLSAQNIEVIAYVPVKIAGPSGSGRGYEYLSVKSRAQFADSRLGSAMTINSFRVNSSLLVLDTTSLQIPGTIFVRNSAFIREGVNFEIGELRVGGFFYANGDVTMHEQMQTVLRGYHAAVAANVINAGSKSLRLQAFSKHAPSLPPGLIPPGGTGAPIEQIIYIDKVPFYPPPANCFPYWNMVHAMDVNNKAVDYQVLMCK